MATPPPGTDAARLTIVALVSHEQDPLEATLRGWSQSSGRDVPVIVMDCSESSRIAQVCRQHQARRLTPAVEEHLAAAWNEALQEVETDWALCVEAGETLAPDSLAALLDFVAREADPSAAYVAMIEIPAGDDRACDEQVAQARLIPQLDAIRFTGRVRPTMLPAISQAGLDLRHSGVRIQRGPDEYTEALRNGRAERDRRLAERQMAEEGASAELFVAWGEALTVLGQHSDAADKFKRALPLAVKGSTTMLEAYYGLLSSLDHHSEAREAQLSACLEALEVFSLDAQLLCGMGSYMLGQNRPDLAARSYSIALGHGQVDPQTWHLSEVTAVAASCLSLTQQLQGEESAARATLEEALTRLPDSVRLRRQLLNILIKQGDAEAALAEFNRLPSTLPMREALRCAVRGALLASQQGWLSALPYLHTAYTAGCRDVICLRWLSATLLATGDMEGARPVLLAWRQAEPHNAELQSYLAALEQTRPTGKPATAPSETGIGPGLGGSDPAKKIRIDTRRSEEPAPRTRAVPTFESAFHRDMPDSPTSV